MTPASARNEMQRRDIARPAAAAPDQRQRARASAACAAAGARTRGRAYLREEGGRGRSRPAAVNTGRCAAAAGAAPEGEIDEAVPCQLNNRLRIRAPRPGPTAPAPQAWPDPAARHCRAQRRAAPPGSGYFGWRRSPFVSAPRTSPSHAETPFDLRRQSMKSITSQTN